MKYAFHAEAVQYYAEQRAEVAQAFIDAVEDAVYHIRESPPRYIVVDEDFQRCMTRRFPYGILYTIEPDYIVILVMMHCNREPKYWKSRR